jgi:urea ABC transporter urea binding protein
VGLIRGSKSIKITLGEFGWATNQMTSMATDPRVSGLLLAWQKLTARGQTVTVDELCHDCPELADELRRQVAAQSSETTLFDTRDEQGASSVQQTSGVRPTAQALPPTVVAPPLSLPGYEILEELGRGGMGVVYKARQIGLNRLVAIKMILAGSRAGPLERARFHAEAEAVARLHHLNIVQIYQIDQHEGSPYFSMEFVEGESLLKRIGGKPGSPLQAARLVETLARAMHYAHERGVVHRDLKPANILVEGPTDAPLDECIVKITDFGLAKQLEGDARLTKTGTVMGTLCYMAPEQIQGLPEQISASVDVYALGGILYEMLTGRPPFEASTDYELMRLVVSDPPQPPSKWQPNVPPELDAICLHALEKAQQDRFESAEALADALWEFAGPGEISGGSGARKRGKSAARDAQVQATSEVRQKSAASDAGRRFRRRAILAGAVTFSIGALVGGGAVIRRLGRHDQSADGAGDADAIAPPSGPPVKVGVLHSLSGTMRFSTTAVVDATMLAIEELNQQGGVLSRPIQGIVVDGTSDPNVFAREAQRLIADVGVCTIFGCWTSSSRKAVRPIVETNDHLLMYPVDSEGLEESPNIAYLGAAPNQQIVPAVQWCSGFLDKHRYFLVGSDYVFPRAANEIIKDKLKNLRAAVVGEEYLLLGDTEVGGLVKKIIDAKPDLILNSINGDSNVAFFRALRRAGVMPQSIPVMSFSIGEQELLSMTIADMVGNYVAGNYFQSLDLPQNRKFVQAIKDRYGPERVTTGPMESAYSGVYLWAQAVRQAGSDDVRAIRKALAGQRYDAPGGPVEVEPTLLNTYKYARVGQIKPNGQFEIVYTSPAPLPPEPYPKSRTRQQWNAYLEQLCASWGGHWENPGT